MLRYTVNSEITTYLGEGRTSLPAKPVDGRYDANGMTLHIDGLGRVKSNESKVLATQRPSTGEQAVQLAVAGLFGGDIVADLDELDRFSGVRNDEIHFIRR